MRWISRRPSPATVIASLALLVACGGTSYAAVALPANSVGTAQLKSNAVTSQKVLNGSLLKVDFKANQLPAGAAGAAGATGPTGPAGPAGTARWALVRQDGAILAQSGGITAAHVGTGHYILDFGSPETGKLILASMSLAGDNNFRGPVDASPCGGAPDSRPFACPAPNDTNHVEVFTSGPGSTSDEDHSFYVAVFG